MDKWVNPYAQLVSDWSFSEKYAKKLIGRMDVEDVLKKLEKLLSDEALMTTVQVLHVVDNFDNKVTGLDDKVTDIDNKVTGVDNKMNEVIDGAQGTF
jgi:hypothetical protein